MSCCLRVVIVLPTGVFPLDVIRDSQVCYKILSAHRPFYSNNARNAVKYHFFLGIVSVWWLLQPSTPPIPHKSTDSNLMCGLGSFVWNRSNHTVLTIPKRLLNAIKTRRSVCRRIYCFWAVKKWTKQWVWDICWSYLIDVPFCAPCFWLIATQR